MKHDKALLPPKELFEYYLELRKVQRKKVSELERQKQELHNLSNLLLEVKIFSGRVLVAVQDTRAKLYSMLHENSDEEKCIKLQDIYYRYQAMFSRSLMLRSVIKKVQKAALKEILRAEAHMMNIEKCLLSIEGDMRIQLEPKKKRKWFSSRKASKTIDTTTMAPKKTKVKPVYFKTSISKCSFTSSDTKVSNESRCLGSTLLKKWLNSLIESSS